MDAHVGDQAAAHFGIAEFERRAKRVARGRSQHHRRANHPRLNLLLRRHVSGIEAPLKPRLEKYARGFHLLEHLAGFFERHGDGLLAEHRLPIRDRVQDHFLVRAGGGHHGYRFHIRIGQQFLVALVPLGHAEFPREPFGQLRFLVRHRHQPRVGDALRQVLRIHPPQPSQPNRSHVQPACHAYDLLS